MKASELIAELQKLIDEHGDLETMYEEWPYYITDVLPPRGPDPDDYFEMCWIPDPQRQAKAPG